MKRLLSLVLALTVGLCFGLSVHSAPSSGASPTLSAESAILISAEDGQVLYAKNPDAPMGPASTTKLMTALVALERLSPETVVSVSPDAVGVEGSSVYLVAGEELTLRELLYALLLASANDAAAAIAIAAAGSIEAFAAAMNQKAADLGLTRTHFTNPHGLADEAHYTTARELARIASAALEIPLLREIVSTYKTTIPHDGKPDVRLLVNHNKLLRTYKGAIGMKTGYTKKTGRTLVSAAEREGLTLVAVTLRAPDDWRDHTALLDYGFARYERVTFAAPGAFLFQLPVTGGREDSVTLTNTEPLSLILPKERGEPSYRVAGHARFLFAPVAKDMDGWTVTLSCEGQTVSSGLVTARQVEAASPEKEGFWSRLLSRLGGG